MSHDSTSDLQRPLTSPTTVVSGQVSILWVADSKGGRVLCMDAGGSVIAVLGGAEPALVAPRGLFLTGDDKQLFIADIEQCAVFQAGVIAGDDGSITLGQVTQVVGELPAPWALAVDSSAAVIYFAAADENRIFRVAMDDSSGSAGQPSALAGTGECAVGDGLAERASFARPTGLALSPDRRRLYVVDSRPMAIRVVDLASSEVTTLATIAEQPEADSDGASHLGPNIALSPAGLVVADPRAGQLYGVNIRHGTVVPMWRDGATGQAGLPAGVAFDRVTRTYVVTDASTGRLLRISRDAQNATEIAVRDRATQRQ